MKPRLPPLWLLVVGLLYVSALHALFQYYRAQVSPLVYWGAYALALLLSWQLGRVLAIADDRRRQRRTGKP